MPSNPFECYCVKGVMNASKECDITCQPNTSIFIKNKLCVKCGSNSKIIGENCVCNKSNNFPIYKKEETTCDTCDDNKFFDITNYLC